MSYLLKQFQLFVRESIHPKMLAGQILSLDEFDKWRTFLFKESEEILYWVEDLTTVQRQHDSKYMFMLVTQLTALSNIVQKYLIKYYNIWRHHPDAAIIRTHYLLSCTKIEDIIAAIGDYHPKCVLNARVTHYRLTEVKINLKKRKQLLADTLDKSGVEPSLKELVLTGLGHWISKKNITNQETSYIENLIEKLQAFKNLTSVNMVELLVVHNFNIPEFFLYCVNDWENKLIEIEGLYQQQEYILNEKNKLFEFKTLNKKSFFPVSGGLYEDLENFLTEKFTYIDQLITVRKAMKNELDKASKGYRFKINLPVPQYGLFIRMQLERGIIEKEFIGEVFSFFATHFYTSNTPFISAESLQKKSSDVEFSTAQKMKTHIIGMLNWLNTNYNLSNYN